MSNFFRVIATIAILGIAIFLGCKAVIWFAGATCRNEAQAMGFKHDYKFHVIGNSTCTYILPNGKRVLSTKYGVREKE